MLTQYFQADRRTMPPVHHTIAALVLTSVMEVGAWQTIVATGQIGVLDFPHTLLDFREGRTTGALEKQIEHKLPARKTLIATANSMRFLLTGGTGEQVRAGRNDWLFLTEELRFDADGAAHLAARASLLGVVSERLDSMGVKLVVALVPDKARVHADKLKTGLYPPYNQTRYQDTLQALRDRKVTVVDLLGPMEVGARASEVYYRTDTHWNQRGAKIAADAIAAVVQRLGVAMTGTEFSTIPSGEALPRPGDLIRLMGLDSTPDWLRPRADQEVPMLTREKSTGQALGLFGDAAVPVVLTGTSYSLRGNFHGSLQEALAVKVLNAAKDGGGFLQATTAYLTDDSFKSAKPTVLVWELPERFVLTALDAEPNWIVKVGLAP